MMHSQTLKMFLAADFWSELKCFAKICFFKDFFLNEANFKKMVQ